MTKVIILSQKTIAKNMAGPGIRVWELAKQLSLRHKVSVLAPQKSKLAFPNVQILDYSFINTLKELIKSDVVMVQIFFLKFHWLILAWLLRKKIVIDAYFAPYLENREKYSALPNQAKIIGWLDSLRTKILFMIGDFFICASSRQKELWQKWFSVLGRSAINLIDVVPIGVRENTLAKSKRVLKGVINGIEKEDKVILWLSGIWPWFDPISIIKAIDRIKDERVKLVFLGLAPTDEFFKDEKNNKQEEAIELSKRLGLFNRRVFFIFKRVPYQDVPDYLLEADIAANIHYDHLETKYAFRGRILDYIWANIPIIATRGDVLAEQISGHGLGIVVDYEDDKQIAQAILKLIEDKAFYNQCKEKQKHFAINLQWEKVCQPLAKYCANPIGAPDNKGFFIFVYLFFATLYFYSLSLFFLLRYKGLSGFFTAVRRSA